MAYTNSGDYEGIYFDKDVLPLQVIQLNIANSDDICRDTPETDSEITIFEADLFENPHDLHHDMEILHHSDE